MNELQRQAYQRVEVITRHIGSLLAERYGVYDLQSAEPDNPARHEQHDYRALDDHHKRLNDIRVRVHVEDANVTSIYVFEAGDPAAGEAPEVMARSARLTQMSPTAVAVLIAHELVRDGADVDLIT